MKLLLIFLTIFGFCKFSFGQKSLNIYGGENHDVYLGCLNFSDIDQNSIWNDIGTYGSDFSSYTPWNDISNYPPVIVDKDGGFYGYFITNEEKDKRADFNLVLTLYKYHDLIKDDVSKWYNKLFK